MPATTSAQNWLAGWLDLGIPPHAIYATEECLDMMSGEALDTAPVGFDGLVWTLPDGSLLIANSCGAVALRGGVMS